MTIVIIAVTSVVSPLGKRLLYYVYTCSEREIEVVIWAVHQNISALLLPAMELDCPSFTTLKLGQWNISRYDLQPFWCTICQVTVFLPYGFLLDKIKCGNDMLAQLLLIRILLNCETVLLVWSSDRKTTERTNFISSLNPIV